MKQEGDKWVYGELSKIHTKGMEEMEIDPCYRPRRCKEILPQEGECFGSGAGNPLPPHRGAKVWPVCHSGIVGQGHDSLSPANPEA